MALIVVLFSIISISSFSQTLHFTDTIIISQNFTTSAEIYPFSQNTVYGLSIEGNITLMDENSIVKIILRDSLSMDYLIYETNAYLSPLTSFAFSNECEETCFMEGFEPTSIEIQLLNASVSINSLSYAGMYVEDATDLQQQFRESKILEKIDLMNDFIQREGLIWNAGKTSSLNMYYNDKKNLYKSSIWNPAIEYYISGFFGLKSPRSGANITVNYDYVDNFDWRNRHGANDPNSSYYDGDPLGSGWITSPACQSGCWINGVLDCSVHHADCTGPGREWRAAATCWAFGPTSHIEALVNLYLNQHYDVNLAEQEIVSCSYFQPHIDPGSPSWSYNYYKNVGVVNEDCFPYTAQPDDCEDCCATPLERIKINDYIVRNSSSVTQEELRETIMSHGPVSAVDMNIMWGPWAHSMQIVGWDIIKWGDEGIMGIPPNPNVFKDYVGCT